MTSAHDNEFMQFDVAVVGSGLAGMSVALHLSTRHRVLLIAKDGLQDGASSRAQGGIAAVLDSHDSVESHLADTLLAGDGLCDQVAARFIIENGAAAIEWLIGLGVPFTTDALAQRGFHLTREGGHSQRRIIHAADATGQAVQATLERTVRARPGITVLEQHIAMDLIRCRHPADGNRPRCLGLHLLHTRSGMVRTVAATYTVLATGGAGQAYLHTTNPAGATGDGIAMAWRAGCRVVNMEFIQFHPTCAFHPDAQSFLISEAVRGEGGLLRLPVTAGTSAGERFMPRHDARAELAPRDIVARAIESEMKAHGLDHVDLDISHKPPEFIRAHFPNIRQRCAQLGIDIETQPVPVVPAAHYLCGGVATDLHGQTDLAGLYAVGETGYTGLHGANRLASNSLLECLVLGRAAARHIDMQPPLTLPPLPRQSMAHHFDDEAAGGVGAHSLAHYRDQVQRLMWNCAGIMRKQSGLLHGRHQAELLQSKIDASFRRIKPNRELMELRNLIQVAGLIMTSALTRAESRGLHYTADFPYRYPAGLPTVLTPPLHASGS